MKKKKLKEIAQQLAQLEKAPISQKEKELKIMSLVANLSLDEMLTVDSFTEKYIKNNK